MFRRIREWFTKKGDDEPVDGGPRPLEGWNRREAIQGLGFLGMGLLFRNKLGALVAEPVVEEQLPSAIDITVRPQAAFRPRRLVVSSAIAHLFVIENITVGKFSQFVGDGGISAQAFTSDAMLPAMHLDVATAATDITFRVRYVGTDPKGAQFMGALIGEMIDSAPAPTPGITYRREQRRETLDERISRRGHQRQCRRTDEFGGTGSALDDLRTSRAEEVEYGTLVQLVAEMPRIRGPRMAILPIDSRVLVVG